MSGRSDPNRRRRDAALAGHRGDAAAARSYLDDSNPKVREAALRALDRIEPEIRFELERALTDVRPSVRAAALELAARRPEIPNVLVADRLFDPDPRVVEAAAWTCGECSFAPDLADLVSALAVVACGHADALCRESAVAALGSLGHPSGLSAVLAALDDKPAVRRRAVIALTPFAGPEVDAAMDRARSDRDRQVREAVEELLGPGPPPSGGASPGGPPAGLRAAGP